MSLSKLCLGRRWSRGLWIAVWRWGLALSTAPLGAAELQQPAATLALDTRWITPEVCAVAVGQPQTLLESPLAKELPTEVIAAWAKADLGLEVNQVEFVQVMLEKPTIFGPFPQYAVLFKLNSPFEDSRIGADLLRKLELTQLGKFPFWVNEDDRQPSLLLVEGNQLLLGTEDMLLRLGNQDPAQTRSPLLDKVGQRGVSATAWGYVHTLPLGNLLHQAIGPHTTVYLPKTALPIVEAQQYPDHLSMQLGMWLNFTQETFPILAAQQHLEGVFWQWGAAPGTRTRITAECASAAKAAELLNALQAINRQRIEAATLAQRNRNDLVDQAIAQYQARTNQTNWEEFTPVQEGETLVLWDSEFEQNSGKQSLVTLAVREATMNWLLPAISSARASARRATSVANLWQLSSAWQAYYESEKSFPPTYSQNRLSRPLLSWRVHLLPLLGEAELYGQFKLDEPWDGPNNLPLVEKMPKVFQSPEWDLAPGMTAYLAVSGRGFLSTDGPQRRWDEASALRMGDNTHQLGGSRSASGGTLDQAVRLDTAKRDLYARSGQPPSAG